MIHDMPAAKPNVFTIPASAPFLPALIDALLAGRLVPGFPAAAIRSRSPPPRSICRRGAPAGWRAMSSSMRSKRDAAILPRIVPLGDIDEDEIAFAEAATAELADAALELPPALGGLERRMPLAALILRWADTIAPRGAARRRWSPTTRRPRLRWRNDLARLMDDMTTRQVSWDRLDDLVPDELDRYWELTLNFLKIHPRALAGDARRDEAASSRPSGATN